MRHWRLFLVVVAGAVILVVATAVSTYAATSSSTDEAKAQSVEAIQIAENTVDKLENCVRINQSTLANAQDALALARRYKKQADWAEDWMLLVNPPRQAAGVE